MKNSTYFSKSDPKKVEEPTATGVLHLTKIFVENNSEEILLAFIKLSTNFLAKRTDVRDSFFTVATWGRLQYVFWSVEQKIIVMHLQYANGTDQEKCDIHSDVVALHKLP